MIQEMERAIEKREQIAVRYRGKSDASTGKAHGNRRAVGEVGGAGGLGDLTAASLRKKVCTCSRYLTSSGTMEALKPVDAGYPNRGPWLVVLDLNPCVLVGHQEDFLVYFAGDHERYLVEWDTCSKGCAPSEHHCICPLSTRFSLILTLAPPPPRRSALACCPAHEPNKVVSVQRQLNATNEESHRYAQAVAERRTEVEALSNDLQEASARSEEAARRTEELRTEINDRWGAGVA